MVGQQHLKSDFVKRVNQIKYGTPYIQIQLTLKELPQFTRDLAFANQDRINWFMSYSKGPEHLQRCVDVCKWGDIPDDPMWAYYIPSVWDKSMSPPGHYSATIFSFYFPMKVGDGQHRELRNRLAEKLIDSVDRYAPNFRKSILKKAVFTWRNFASMYGITKGDYAHGVLMPEQMFDYRPMVGCADYRTPVESLYLCGAGCHPGPGVTAIPGRNCAMEVMKDMGASPETNTGLDLSNPLKTLGDLKDWGTKALSKLRN
jgi:phytoene dehydrogenase-like protein